jgi:hypothetical protein
LILVTREEWELAEWLIKSLGQTQMDEFLKLPIVSLALTAEKLILTIVIDKKSNMTIIPQQYIVPSEG